MSWLEMQIKPMEPVSCRDSFDSANHMFELKWDGIRMLAFANSNRLRLQNRSLKDRTARFPELDQIVNCIRAEEVILDGEIIVLWQGKPSFHRVMERAMASSAIRIESLSKTMPVVYVVFDILYFNGKWLLKEPLMERKQILQDIVCKEDFLQLSDPLPGNGTCIFEAVSARGLEGVVAKEKNSHYIIGKKDNRWLKIKRRVTQKCIIAGFHSAGQFITSLVMAAYYQNNLVYIGRVSSGLTNETARKLYEIFSAEDKGAIITGAKQSDAVWIRPRYVAEVEFMEWTEDLKMRAPVLKKILWDSRPEECEIL